MEPEQEQRAIQIPTWAKYVITRAVAWWGLQTPVAKTAYIVAATVVVVAAFLG